MTTIHKHNLEVVSWYFSEEVKRNVFERFFIRTSLTARQESALTKKLSRQNAKYMPSEAVQSRNLAVSGEEAKVRKVDKFC